MINLEELERLADYARYALGEADESYQMCAFHKQASPAAILELVAEVRRLREDAGTARASIVEECAEFVEAYACLWSNLPPSDSRALSRFFSRNMREQLKSPLSGVRDCSRCGIKNLAAGTYCKGIACPLNAARAKQPK